MIDQVINNSSFLKFLTSNPLILMLLIVWIFVWKGLALWNAARLSHKWWFIFILVANTVGILDIIYIYFVARKFTVEEVEEEVVQEVEVAEEK